MKEIKTLEIACFLFQVLRNEEFDCLKMAFI